MTKKELFQDALKALPGGETFPLLWETIVNQWDATKEMVLDLEPPTPSNKAQKFIRKALTLFGNLSSLFIYLVLIFVGLKIVVLWMGNTEGLLDRISTSLGPSVILVLLLFILLVMVCVRGLLVISKFVKSYRIMTLIGVITVVTSLAKASVQLVTAKSVSGMSETLGQFLLGAFK